MMMMMMMTMMIMIICILVSQEVGTTKLLLLYNCKTYKMMEKQETVEITRKSSADQLEGISNRKSRLEIPYIKQKCF